MNALLRFALVVALLSLFAPMVAAQSCRWDGTAPLRTTKRPSIMTDLAPCIGSKTGRMEGR